MAHLHVKTPNGTTYSIDLDAINSSGGGIPDSGNNGWGVLANGAIIQWGCSTITSGEAGITITFPQKYTNIFSIGGCLTWNTYAYGLVVKDVTVSNFWGGAIGVPGNGTKVYWMSLGD